MNKKLDYKILITAILNLAICLSLIIFAIPKNVPLFFGFNEKIVLLGSKWFLILCVIIPTILATIIMLSKKQTLKFWIKFIYFICLYENMLIMICTSLSTEFELGLKTEIPLSLIYLLPLSAFIIAMSQKLKNAPYKSFSPFKNKYSTTSEFIWKQTHMTAKNICFAIGFFAIIETLIFSIFRLFLINFIVIVIEFIIGYLIILRESILMSKKHNAMQTKKDNLNK